MAIKNGLLANADDVINGYGSVFSNLAQVMYNNIYIGWDSGLNFGTGEPNLNNMWFDTSVPDGSPSDGNYAQRGYTSSNTYTVLFGEWYDVPDGVVDTSKWSGTGTLTENTSYTEADGGQNSNRDVYLNAYAQNVNPYPATKGEYYFRGTSRTVTNSGSDGTYSYVYLSDQSSNQVLLCSRSKSSWSGSFNPYVWVEQTSATNVRVRYLISGYTGPVYGDTNVDISSLTQTDNWYFKIRTRTTGSANYRVYSRCYATMQASGNNVTTGDILDWTSSISIGDTYTDGIMTANDNITDGWNVTYNLSPDGGSNYYGSALNKINRFNTTGNDLKYKITPRGTNVYSFYKVSEIGVWWNTGAV